VRVHWTENAIDHLANTYEYIAFNSPTYAPRMIYRIKPDQIDVIAVIHGARLMPEDF
jgi:plasmid stabilization system protein ParE